MTTWH